MKEKLQILAKVMITSVLVFQLSGCGTLLYPERRGQTAGHLDAGVVILDAVGLLFFLIPGIIAFAVDFSNGCIYLPAHPVVVVGKVSLRVIKFDPKHTSLAQLEKIIKDQTGQTVNLAEANVRVTHLKSKAQMNEYFVENTQEDQRLALNQ